MKSGKLTYITAMMSYDPYQSVHRRLNMYALAAVVVVLLALTQPSGARIVYTPTHIKVDSPFNLDLNHDRTTDFTLQQAHNVSNCDGKPDKADYLYVSNQFNGVVVVASDTTLAAALDRDVEIGPNQQFQSLTKYMGFVEKGYIWGRGHGCYFFQTIGGDWVNVSNRYLGLKFQIKGKTHYGWARLSSEQDGQGDRAAHLYTAARGGGRPQRVNSGRQGKPHCAFPGINPNAPPLLLFKPIGRSVYNGLQTKLSQNAQHPVRWTALNGRRVVVRRAESALELRSQHPSPVPRSAGMINSLKTETGSRPLVATYR